MEIEKIIPKFYLQDDNSKIFEVDLNPDQYPDAQSTTDNECKNVCFLEPIPITEDWLVKFGFEMRLLNGIVREYNLDCTPDNYKYNYYLSFRFGMYRNSDKIEFNWRPVFSGTMHTFKCDYIHELQNIFRVLTGKELTYESN